MRLIEWGFSEGKEETVKKIRATFENELDGKRIVFSKGSFLLLYWFPPWSLGPDTGGNPDHNLITESFSFVGVIKNEKGGTHIKGITFYRIVLRLMVALYFLAGALLRDKTEEMLMALVTFGVLGLVVCGLIEKGKEDDMNRTVRAILGMYKCE